VYAGATVAAWYPITPSTSVMDAFKEFCDKYRKDPETVASAVELLLADESLRGELVAAGRARCAQLDPEKARAAFVAAVERAGSR